MTVMIVEDEALIRLELMQRIELMGHTVVGATASGEEAVEQARRERPELILMDVKLKGKIDGIEALRRISRFHACGMTILSAFGREQLREERELPEDVRFFSKPLADADLRTILDEAI